MKKKAYYKLMATAVSTGMIAGAFPTNVFAVTGPATAADGTYSSVQHVTSDEDQDFAGDEYDVSVTLSVQNGIFTGASVVPAGSVSNKNASYFSKAADGTKKKASLAASIVGQPANADTIAAWDVISGATCTSTAIKNAALQAIAEAPEAVEAPGEEETPDPVDPENPNPTDPENPDDTEQPEDGKEEDDKKEEDSDKPEAEQKDVEFVLMNIPYNQFYAADLNNGVAVDCMSSATMSKTRNSSMVGGSYHPDNSGSSINGVTFPVKVPKGADLSSYVQVTNDTTLEITTNNRGQSQTVTYGGPEANQVNC